MLPFVYLLCAFDVAARAYVSHWSFKLAHDRTPVARHNEYLRFADLAGLTALGAAFFMSLALGRGLAFAGALVVGILIVDGVLRFIGLHSEAKRLCRSRRGYTYQKAVRRVRRRAKSPVFE